MRRIYTFLLYLLIPFIVLRLYWKGKRLPAYRSRILERFSVTNVSSFPVDVWLHAVSLGEVVAAIPLIDALLAQKKAILVTTMTPTGSQQIASRFGNQVVHQYLPYDFPWVLRRFFKTINAKIGIIMETELWPNLITEAKRCGLPIVLANARISDKAYLQYHRARYFFKPILHHFSDILAQSEQDGERFLALGATRDCVKVIGNMKFDLQIKAPDKRAFALKELWGNERVVVMAASTHDDEEQQILSQLNVLQKAIPNVVLLITPRHPERFEKVYELSKSCGFKTQKRSQPDCIDAEADVIIIDAMGELMCFYQVSDYAFVGGSLVSIGGHNVLEPIAMKVPVFCGPYMQNSKAICTELCAANAMQQLNDAKTLIEAICLMHQNPHLREAQISQASQVLMANRGAVQRHLDVINTYIQL